MEKKGGEGAAPRHTCLKLVTEPDPIFVKDTWFSSHFHLSITDGLHSWLCNATEEEAKERAEQWDQPVSVYIQLAETHLGFQMPGSVYRFTDAGDGYKRLSWTFEKEGTKLEWRWKCQPSPDSKKSTAGILDFLMDANIRLSFLDFDVSLVANIVRVDEEVVKKTESFERLKGEAEKCLTQSEKFSSEKMEFESAIYGKFLSVLNAKKRKLRELRDQLSKKEASGKFPQEEESEKTESFDEDTDHEKSEEELPEKLAGTSTNVSSTRGKGRNVPSTRGRARGRGSKRATLA
ncbi:DNA repair protein xrcc4 [Turnera subulata]|uniref:DNA repair protein xrcc4 n=1 Tax=Turnera subulata TaxID=218843 RepID=A0A9Q0FMY8_9ROSI|nr:DNA repair protein xrcc4 [Turnera subulata]